MKFEIGSLVRLFLPESGDITGLVHNHSLPTGVLGIVLGKPSQMSYYDVWNPGSSLTVVRVLVMFPEGPHMVDINTLAMVSSGARKLSLQEIKL